MSVLLQAQLVVSKLLLVTHQAAQSIVLRDNWYANQTTLVAIQYLLLKQKNKLQPLANLAI
jgi:hypothetical protein